MRSWVNTAEHAADQVVQAGTVTFSAAMPQPGTDGKDLGVEIAALPKCRTTEGGDA